MSATALSKREETILRFVVESYVRNAVAVGSGYLSKRFDLGISPATIRNVMNKLEELGYLSQPHVSAGRIPTDKGYRYYVDSLKSVNALAKKDRQIILDHLSRASVDVTEILEVSSQVLGRISSQLGIVLEPRFFEGVFQKMQLVSVTENRIMVVISIRSGLVKTIMMEIESSVSREQLESTSWIINERLSGLSLRDVKSTIDERLRDIGDSDDRLVRLIVRSSDRLFDFEGEDELHLGGTVNILAHPEFSNQEYAVRILELIGTNYGLLRSLDRGAFSKARISIGGENPEDLFRRCSVVTTKYCIGNVTGTLGVLGPTRMHYAKIIPLVHYMGEVLSQKLYTQVC